ncbi:MAG: hypothetical protein ABSE73_20515 [Planctomycetota bacterium]
MSALRIDADALFRAVTASSFKLLVYHLDLESGEVLARTLRPGEIPDAPQGPSVKPLPKLGGDLAPKKDAAPFGPPPVTASRKLFSNDDLPRKPAFANGFWKREEKKRPNPFGQGGFKRESSTKRLAEIFSAKEPQKNPDPFTPPAPAKPACSAGVPPASAGETPAVRSAGVPPASARPDEMHQPRIPVADEAQQLEWVRAFARDFGDPQIREEILHALKTGKPMSGFERVLRKYQRMNQQWDVYFRKQALACAEAWLETLGVTWELVEAEGVK